MPKKHYGIEMLRILMMIGIIALHYLGHGGLLQTTVGMRESSILWLFEAMAYISVNSFVLITGFFQSTGKFKLSKIFVLLLQIEFWSLTTFAVSVFIGAQELSAKTLITACFPFLFDGYWFTTVYLALYLISPFINILLQNLNHRQNLYLLFVANVFSLLPIFNTSIRTGGGNGILWFVVLYLWGAYIRKYGINILNKFGKTTFRYCAICLIAFILSTLMIFSIKVVDIPGEDFITSILWSYASIPVLLGSIFVFLIFLKIRIPEGIGRKISVVSSSTLGVYLIHDSEWIRSSLWSFINNVFPNIMIIKNLFMFPIIIIMIFVVSILLELLRNSFFKLIGVYKATTHISDKIIISLERIQIKDNNI